MAEINKENLDYRGIDFQYAVLKTLIEQPELLRNIYKFLDQNTFSDPYLRMIVGAMKDYYKDIQMTPTYGELKSYMRSKLRKEEDIEYVEAVIERARNTKDFAPEFVSKDITDYMRWRKWMALNRKAAEKSRDGWDETQYNKIVNELEELRNFGQDKSVKWRFDEETAKRTLEKGAEDIIPLGIPELDELVGGGLEKRGLGILIAPTGVGKTTFGTIVAHNAAMNGYKVLQIYFEDQPEEIMRKYLAMEVSSSISFLKGFSSSKSEEFVRRQSRSEGWAKMNENLVMIRMADSETTVEDIENEIITLANADDFRPDVIIIDYFGCLKHSTNPIKNSYEAQSSCMRKIVNNIAFKYRAAVWVLRQTNREGTKDENAGQLSNVSGSHDANTPASILLELRRNHEQAQARDGRADMTIMKSRHGVSNFTLHDIYFDNGRLILDCHDTKEYHDEPSPFELHK